jgi:hypothetical protein
VIAFLIFCLVVLCLALALWVAFSVAVLMAAVWLCLVTTKVIKSILWLIPRRD